MLREIGRGARDRDGGRDLRGARSSPGAAAVVEDKAYALTPGDGHRESRDRDRRDDRHEGDGAGSRSGPAAIVTPAKLTGLAEAKEHLRPRQRPPWSGGKIVYLDGQGQRMKLEDSRTEPILKLDGYGAERPGTPGQEVAQKRGRGVPGGGVEEAKSLKEIRLELTYIQSPYKAEARDPSP